jgi:N6-adenosine-specific RNA methylase IME4
MAANDKERIKLRAPFPSADGSYDVVYADPPWAYYGDPDKNAAAGKHYDLMESTTVQALDVRGLMSDKAALFLWATSPKMDVAIETIKAWGLHFRGIPYVWVKTRQDGQIIGGQGVPPTFVKPTCEFVLAASTVKRGRPFPILDMAQHQVVLAPRGEHSSKPEEVRRRIEALTGPRPRIELFARGSVPGWDVWGEEALISREQLEREQLED